MRKKGHKKINPKNRNYDLFYLVNYREFGKRWDTPNRDLADFEEDELPSGFESNDDDYEGDENDWNDWKGNRPGAVCLFCPTTYPDMNDLLIHMTHWAS